MQNVVKEDANLRTEVSKIQKEAIDLMMGRNLKYGDSWKVLSVQSIANLIEMKMYRIARLGALDAKTEDEFLDCMNYAAMGLMKYKELTNKNTT